MGNNPDDSGDGGSGILGGIASFFRSLFIPDSNSVLHFINQRVNDLDSRTGLLNRPSAYFAILLSKMYESGDFVITIPDIVIPANVVYGANTNHSDLMLFDGDGTNNVINFTQLVQNEPWHTLYSYYTIIISGLFVFLFLSYLWSLYDHILNAHDQDIVSVSHDLNKRL